MSDSGDHDSAAGRRLLLTRLGVGLVQGLVLFGLSEAAEQKIWPATDRALFIALVVMVLGVGPVLLSGLGSLRRRPLIIWTAVAAAVTASIGWMDGYRELFQGRQEAYLPTPLVALAVLVSLFVTHSLIVAAARDGRRIATYPTYFDVAWKHGAQLAMAGAFTGVFWGILQLGSALFGMIGVEAVERVIESRWFAIPATVLAFASAVHLTDVRVGLIQGVRTVGLTLLGWLLPLLAGLGLAFLLTLPFTGLQPLWNTGRAAAILIGAGASLILLTNAAYQDGGREKPLAVALRWAMRLASLLLLPLTALAALALWLRVGQYGLTVDRIIALAAVLIGVCYAVGYAIAALSPGPVMRRLEPTNVATSIVGLVVLLALLSPVADPVRLSVADQVARIEAGKVKPSVFDFNYLRWSSGRFGRDALERLSKSGGEVGRLADAYRRGVVQETEAPPRPASEIKVYPAGRSLPEAFTAAYGYRFCAYDGVPCEAFMLDLDGDGAEEVMMVDSRNEGDVYAVRDKGWTLVAHVDLHCKGGDFLWSLRRGGYRLAPSRWKTIQIGEDQLPVRDSMCMLSAEPPVHQRR